MSRPANRHQVHLTRGTPVRCRRRRTREAGWPTRGLGDQVGTRTSAPARRDPLLRSLPVGRRPPASPQARSARRPRSGRRLVVRNGAGRKRTSSSSFGAPSCTRSRRTGAPPGLSDEDPALPGVAVRAGSGKRIPAGPAAEHGAGGRDVLLFQPGPAGDPGHPVHLVVRPGDEAVERHREVPEHLAGGGLRFWVGCRVHAGETVPGSASPLGWTPCPGAPGSAGVRAACLTCRSPERRAVTGPAGCPPST
jgi:hypothetical protein